MIRATRISFAGRLLNSDLLKIGKPSWRCAFSFHGLGKVGAILRAETKNKSVVIAFDSNLYRINTSFPSCQQAARQQSGHAAYG